MVQYILRQRNQYSCGPIALLNALKWRGENATYDSHYKQLVKECNTDKEGTDDNDFENALVNHGFDFVKTRYLQEVEDHLKAGGAVILVHLDSDDEWHYSFWYEYRFKRFHGANIDYSEDIRNVTTKEMRRYLLRTHDLEDLPQAILLTPNHI